MVEQAADLFGPAIEVDAAASPSDAFLAWTGHDPNWAPPLEPIPRPTGVRPSRKRAEILRGGAGRGQIDHLTPCLMRASTKTIPNGMSLRTSIFPSRQDATTATSPKLPSHAAALPGYRPTSRRLCDGRSSGMPSYWDRTIVIGREACSVSAVRSFGSLVRMRGSDWRRRRRPRRRQWRSSRHGPWPCAAGQLHEPAAHRHHGPGRHAAVDWCGSPFVLDEEHRARPERLVFVPGSTARLPDQPRRPRCQ
jgi:hypothetical protein